MLGTEGVAVFLLTEWHQSTAGQLIVASENTTFFWLLSLDEPIKYNFLPFEII